ncbi:MAG: YkgJ family cysteine cluster protein [Syntrophaceae bacterium]
MMEIKGFLYTKIEFAGFDVLVPFICKKCGLCCSSYVPFISEKLFFAIQYCPGLEDYSFEKFRQSWMNRLKGNPEPCPFLTKNETCLIHKHPLRPDLCRLYPFSFENKDNRCPAYEDHKRLVQALTSGETGFEIYDSSFCPDPEVRPIPENRRYIFLQAFLAARPDPLLVKAFRLLNGCQEPSGHENVNSGKNAYTAPIG